MNRKVEPRINRDGKQGTIEFWFNKGRGGGEHVAVRIDGTIIALPPEFVTVLQAALAGGVQDRELLSSLLELWHRQGRREEGRQALEACLAFASGNADLWLARLALEDIGSSDALEVSRRWVEAQPQSVNALGGRLAALEHAGRLDEADAIADRIVALQPGHGAAQARKVNALVARDPAAAVMYVQGLLAQAQGGDARALLYGWLGMAQDRAGQAAEAVASWSVRAQQSPSLPLPLLGPPAQAWPALAAVPEQLALLRPLLAQEDAALLAKVDGNLQRVHSTLAKYRTADGFESYEKLTDGDRTALKGPITALAEDLAQFRGVLGLNAPVFKDYVKFIGNRRLAQLGLPQQYPGIQNPFPWMSEMMDLKKEKNFFETRVTEYQTGGALSWD